MTQEDRRNGRINFESSSFDENIYLYQYFNDEDIMDIINFPSPWIKLEVDKCNLLNSMLD